MGWELEEEGERETNGREREREREREKERERERGVCFTEHNRVKYCPRRMIPRYVI